VRWELLSVGNIDAFSDDSSQKTFQWFRQDKQKGAKIVC
jgi:hypothetical protein